MNKFEQVSIEDHQMSLAGVQGRGGPVNKFEQVSIEDRQMSLAGVQGRGSHVSCLKWGVGGGGTVWSSVS